VQFFFTDTVVKFIPPKKSRKHILRIISEVLHLTTIAKTNNYKCIGIFTNVVKKKIHPHLLSPTFFDKNFEQALSIASKKRFGSTNVTDTKKPNYIRWD
jgi:hypothetical protein